MERLFKVIHSDGFDAPVSDHVAREEAAPSQNSAASEVVAIYSESQVSEVTAPEAESMELPQSDPEGDESMESRDNLPPSYPFVAADMDIDMIDKRHLPAVNGAEPVPVSASSSTVVDTARQLVGLVQDLEGRIAEQQAEQARMQQQINALLEMQREFEALKSLVREIQDLPVSAEDLSTLQRVVGSLAHDPDHIMVLASVAQESSKLFTVVNGFTKLRDALD